MISELTSLTQEFVFLLLLSFSGLFLMALPDEWRHLMKPTGEIKGVFHYSGRTIVGILMATLTFYVLSKIEPSISWRFMGRILMFISGGLVTMALCVDMLRNIDEYSKLKWSWFMFVLLLFVAIPILGLTLGNILKPNIISIYGAFSIICIVITLIADLFRYLTNPYEYYYEEDEIPVTPPKK